MTVPGVEIGWEAAARLHSGVVVDDKLNALHVLADLVVFATQFGTEAPSDPLETLNPKPLNPKPLNPKPLNP